MVADVTAGTCEEARTKLSKPSDSTTGTNAWECFIAWVAEEATTMIGRGMIAALLAAALSFSFGLTVSPSLAFLHA